MQVLHFALCWENGEGLKKYCQHAGNVVRKFRKTNRKHQTFQKHETPRKKLQQQMWHHWNLATDKSLGQPSHCFDSKWWWNLAPLQHIQQAVNVLNILLKIVARPFPSNVRMRPQWPKQKLYTPNEIVLSWPPNCPHFRRGQTSTACPAKPSNYQGVL